jgi:hypothetical protein
MANMGGSLGSPELRPPNPIAAPSRPQRLVELPSERRCAFVIVVVVVVIVIVVVVVVENPMLRLGRRLSTYHATPDCQRCRNFS